MKATHLRLLADLAAFVEDEQRAAVQRLLEIWDRPLADKLRSGWTQKLLLLERGPEAGTLWAHLDDGSDADDGNASESRFREGDMLLLHTGHPLDDLLARSFVLESDDGERWLLRGRQADEAFRAVGVRACYADADAFDLSALFERTLEDIGSSQIGRELLLPLLCGELEPSFIDAEVTQAEAVARQRGFNPRQGQALGLAVGAEHVACIQGPPGTGKSAVLALAVRLLVERGERVFVTSHTHMAINNALNKVAQEGVAVVKIGVDTQCKGLDASVARCGGFADWQDRPQAANAGYAVGATPFATCTQRLEGCEFDAVVFDEASQVTVPLALMAMRKARRFIFFGDPRQLPPVMLSRSVLDADSMSAFVALTSLQADHAVMLDQTYRMNRWLADWPSRTHYGGALQAAGANRERRLALRDVPAHLQAVLDPQAPGVFVATRNAAARTRNDRDAELVAQLCAAAVGGGLAPQEIGVVTPYRAQGRALRNALRQALGAAAARAVVADTVERMQGQERELLIVSLATGDAAFLGAVAGFFFQPQRLNVAITRARTKLIFIGPRIEAVPEIESPQVQRWVAQYVDLLRHLQHVQV
jgi:DNA replication ATP-dependent helicase Dna2